MTIEEALGPVRLRRWWLPPCAVLGALSFAVVQSDGWHAAWAISVVLWFSLACAGPALVALALQHVSKLHAEVADLSPDPLRVDVRPIQLVGSGVAFLSVALVSGDIVTALPFVGWARVVALIIIGSSFVSYGALAYIYAVTLEFAVRMGKVQVRGDLFAWPNAVIDRIHAIYFRLLLVGLGIYLLGVTVVWLSPDGRWLTMNEMWMRLWVVPPGVLVLVFFATFSIALHQLLLQCRARAESEINVRLQTLYEAWKANRDSSVEGSISALLAWREGIRLERVWSLDLKAGIVTVLTILIPTFEAVVKLASSASQFSQR